MNERNMVLILVSLSVIVLAGFAAGLGPVEGEAISIPVNCSSGQTISGALARAPSSQPVTITVTGLCAESVIISRDDVTIQGASPSSGIVAPSPAVTVLLLKGAHRIALQQLKIKGGNAGLAATLGSSFQATGLMVTNQSSAGIGVAESSAGELESSTIANITGIGIGVQGGSLTMSAVLVENSGVGIGAQGGSIVVNGSTVENSALWGVAAGGSILLQGTTVRNSGSDGVIAFPGGSTSVNGATIEDNGGNGIHANGGGVTINGGVITSNSEGVVAGHGSSVEIGGASVTANHGDGVLGFNGGTVLIIGNTMITGNSASGLSLTIGSSANIQCSSQPFVCPSIENNSGNGVSVHDTSVVGVSSGLSGPPPSVPSIINNGKWGIFCSASGPGGISGPLQATLTGNSAGQNNCPVYQ